MASKSLRDQLNHLHALIMEERECAKKLAMDELMAVSQEKEELLASLESVEYLDLQDRSLVETIKYENRRNAYLFWSTLKWIRESMEFFGKQVSPSAYNPGGKIVRNQCGGRLLSGKV